MDQLCGDEFWNWRQSWYTEMPQLSSCFQNTALIWTPCGFLWLFVPYEIYHVRKSKSKFIPWNWLNSAKLISTTILTLLTLLSLLLTFSRTSRSYPAEYIANFLKLVTYVAIIYFIYLHRKRGVRSSGTIFLFWMLLAICSLPQYLTSISHGPNPNNPRLLFAYVITVIVYPLILFVLALNLFPDSQPTQSKYPPTDNPIKDYEVSFPVQLLTLWFDKFAYKAYKKPIDETKLWDVNFEDSAAYLTKYFERKWRYRAGKKKKSEKNVKIDDNDISLSSDQSLVWYEKAKPENEVSVIRIILDCFGWKYLSLSALKLASDIIQFANPQLLRVLIAFEEQENTPSWHGYLYAATLMIVGMTQTLLFCWYLYYAMNMGLRMRTVLTSVIYKKALKISNGARKMFSTGQIMNLMSVDAQRFYDLNVYLNFVLFAPLTIALSMYFLWNTLGVSVLAGLAVMILAILINGSAMVKVKKLQYEQMKLKDQRVKITNEVITGIKILKMYAWEKSFEKEILNIRNREIKILYKIAFIDTAMSIFFTCTPFLVTLATFGVYSLSPSNILDAQTVFVALSLFNIIKLPLSVLPRMFPNVIQTIVAAKRIGKFLNSEELDLTAVSHDKLERDPLVIESGNFTWDRNEDVPTLRNINIRVPSSTLVAVVGTVGCGKTSLVSAFLGEMEKISGYINTKGKIAYVPQQAWIQNATVRNNVTFTSPYRESSYNKVIEACALKQDFKIFPAGDSTEIGEKGVNLSGGQKQRISLARAIYNNADVYILDDPLSAVDAHVGKHIFQQVIGPNGLLRKKTRLFVTNAVTYLPEVDLIVVMKEGTVVETGTYAELSTNGNDFAEFLNTHKPEFGEDEDEKMEKDSTKIGFSHSISEDGSYPAEHADIRRSISHQPVVGEKIMEEEIVETGKIKFDVYIHYVVSGGIFFWLGIVAFNLLYQTFSVAANLCLSTWSMDESTLRNGTYYDRSNRGMYYSIYALLGVGQIFSTMIATLVLFGAAISASKHLHISVLTKVLSWPTYLFDITPLGRILTRFSYDIDVVDNTLPFSVRQVCTIGGTVISTLFIISYSTPIFVVAIVPIAVFYFIFQQLYVATLRQLRRIESKSRSPIYSHFGETITGAACIRAYRMEEKFITEAQTRIDTNQKHTYPSILANRWASVRLEFIGNFIVLLAAIFAVSERGILTAGLLGLSISYALQITGSLNWLVRFATEFETNIVAVERLRQYQNTKEESYGKLVSKTVSKNWPSRGEIIFENYSTRYREGLELVLRNLTFKINSGEKVGIVGRTGSGKSTVALSLFRIIEAAAGRIIIDDVDISTISYNSLRSSLTIIPQDPVLFSGSLRMNLDPFEEHTDGELWHVLALVNLKDFVAGLTSGLYQVISESGDNLSVGQRQLVCLARALLRKTQILILDEATAAIDLDTDDLIQKTIRSEFHQCTVLTIAHRLNTIIDADRIMVLDNGKLAEFDAPEVLLKQPESVFYKMAKDAGLVSNGNGGSADENKLL